jgi:hypothetical protein
MLTRLALIFSVIAVGLASTAAPDAVRSRRFDAIAEVLRRSPAPKSCAEVLRRSPASRAIFGAQAATLGVEVGAVVYRWENAGSVP